jgi:tRNA (guanine37-N1)-methyltransferase
MRFDVITIFPEVFSSPLKVSLLGKAIASGLIQVEVHDLRKWGEGPHRNVDDAPFGGGAGMVMTPGPIVAAVEEVRRPGGQVVLLSAAGRAFTQTMAAEFAEQPQVVLICGRYEGVDQRVVQVLGALEVSIGEFVLSGGELAALIVIEAVARLTPGVVGSSESLREESFASGLLEYPQYTRPANFRGLTVPDVLLSGDHAKVDRWRREQALRRTFEVRPELLERVGLSPEEESLVSRWRAGEQGKGQ